MQFFTYAMNEDIKKSIAHEPILKFPDFDFEENHDGSAKDNFVDAPSHTLLNVFLYLYAN